jgi:hypothetical protein
LFAIRQANRKARIICQYGANAHQDCGMQAAQAVGELESLRSA